MTRRRKFDRDAASMEMEYREMAEREDAVRALAPELALALKAAYRIILASVPNDYHNNHVWNNNWPMVDQTVNKLEEIER